MAQYLIDRKTGAKSPINEDNFKVTGSEIVVIQASKADIVSIKRDGGNLIIKLKSGKTITIQDYFVTPQNELVIEDTANNGELYWVQNNDGNWLLIDSTDELLLSSSNDGAWGLGVAAGLLGAGAIAAAASSSGSDDDNGTTPNPQIDTIPPVDPTITANNGTELAGTGEAGSTITLTRPNGDKETTVVDKDGNWSFKQNQVS